MAGKPREPSRSNPKSGAPGVHYLAATPLVVSPPTVGPAKNPGVHYFEIKAPGAVKAGRPPKLTPEQIAKLRNDLESYLRSRSQYAKENILAGIVGEFMKRRRITVEISDRTIIRRIVRPIVKKIKSTKFN